MDSKKIKKKKNENINPKIDFFSALDSKIQANEAPSDNKKTSKTTEDEFNKTIKKKIINDINSPNYNKKYVTSKGAKTYVYPNLSGRYNFVYEKKSFK